MQANRKLLLAKTGIFLAASMPLALLVAGALGGELGANPVEAITHQTGEWSLRLLLVTLAVTPLRRLTGMNWLVRCRRMLGLFAFFYACLHLTTYVWLDAYFDWQYIFEDVVERLYITVGFSAFLVMLPLALTSTDGMVRRLGGRGWRALHRLSYVAGAAAVLHFLWLVKADYSEPLIYAAVLTLLMVLRIPPVAARLSKVGARAGALAGTALGKRGDRPPLGTAI